MIDFKEGEYIIAVIRKHWWKLVPWAVGLSLLAILPAVVIVSFFDAIKDSLDDRIINLGGLLYSIWLIILWILFYVDWTDYYLDVWVVTNHRLIDIEQRGLFYRDVATVRLQEIQDLRVEHTGMISTIFDFGDIMIQTAGATDQFKILNAKKPERAKEIIYSAIHGAKSS